MKIKMSFDSEKVKKKIAATTQKCQTLLKNEVAKGSDKYVPFLNGKLAQSVQSSIKADGPYLIYNTPYARYVYYGVAMEGKPPMQPTDRPLRYTTAFHPQAGPQWFEKWKASEGDGAIDKVKEAARQYYKEA